ncbi:MAG TPA: lasso peptide biosynthesis B2 protein [Mycobacteriales bacterium]|nr:lasso peptide biosynthesis B2 protein [Mycobacteriales bacterium]
MTSALWARRALSQVRQALRGRVDWRDIDVPTAPPSLRRWPASAVLRACGATCLERSLVLQRWESDHGRRVDVVVGVRRRPFRAHAWLDGESAPSDLVEFQRRTG